MITLTETLIIWDITKTEFNNCFIIHCIFITLLTNNDLWHKQRLVVKMLSAKTSSENDLKYHKSNIKNIRNKILKIKFYLCIYSQTGCSLASNIAILSHNIAILIGRLLRANCNRREKIASWKFTKDL